MKSRKKDDLDRFKAWVAARGGEVLLATNEWELVRFRGDGVTSIIYTSKTGRLTYTGRAAAAWEAFKSGDCAFRISQRPARQSQRQRKSTPIVRTLLARDGDECFYCGDPFSEQNPPTKEHLVPVTAGGPNHLANLFLAHALCNHEAGHLSAVEKIKMRERKRATSPADDGGDHVIGQLGAAA